MGGDYTVMLCTLLRSELYFVQINYMFPQFPATTGKTLRVANISVEDPSAGVISSLKLTSADETSCFSCVGNLNVSCKKKKERK